MLDLAILISPLAKGAFFDNYISVCHAEIEGLQTVQLIDDRTIGNMVFLNVKADRASLIKIARLSFVHGIFEKSESSLKPLDILTDFKLHEDFVFGSKFKGKTNELLTQLLINVGLKQLPDKEPSQLKLLDPMCGRATTLLWAMRYGINAKGIEQDAKAIEDIRRNTKKWCKIHRQKHQLNEGFIEKSNKKNIGKFLQFSANDVSMKVIIGDTVDTEKLLNKEKFHLIISDLPYGIQHSTTDTRNIMETLESCANAWVNSLKPEGVIALSFNSNNPKRGKVIDIFRQLGLNPIEFSIPHRMSESIVRDVVIFSS